MEGILAVDPLATHTWIDLSTRHRHLWRFSPSPWGLSSQGRHIFVLCGPISRHSFRHQSTFNFCVCQPSKLCSRGIWHHQRKLGSCWPQTCKFCHTFYLQSHLESHHHAKLSPQQLPSLYRSICQLQATDIEKLPISEMLKVILIESEDLRNFRKAALHASHRAKNSSTISGQGTTCQTCKNKRLDEQCIRILYVTFADGAALCGSAIVPHGPDDPDSVIPKVRSIYRFFISC